MSKEAKNTCFIFFILLVFSNFFSFIYLSDLMKIIQGCIILLFFFIVFFNNSESYKKLYLSKYIHAFILFPYLSSIPAYFSHGQTPFQSFLALFSIAPVLLLYYVLLKYKVSERSIFKAIIVFTIIYSFLELYQQLTYPAYWFVGRLSTRSSGELEMRLGMHRFYISGIHFVVLGALFYWDRLITKFNKITLSFFIISLTGIYAFLARKMLFALIFCMALSFFMGKKIKWYIWVLFLTAGLIVYTNQETILGNFVENTQTELSDEDFSRFNSIEFYMSYFDDLSCLILGNGKEYPHSKYGQYIIYLQELHLYKADIGVLGYFNTHGIAGCIPILFFLIFLLRKWSKLSLYIKLYFIFWGIQLIFAFPLNSPIGSVALVIILYLMELDLQKADQKELTPKLSVENK